MQRFLRKPVRVTLATLLGVYRAVMRLSSVTDALDDAIEKAPADTGEEEKTRKGVNGEAADDLSGGLLMRNLLITPLQQVCWCIKMPCTLRSYICSFTQCSY